MRIVRVKVSPAFVLALLVALTSGCNPSKPPATLPPSGNASTPAGPSETKTIEIRVNDKFAFETDRFICLRNQPIHVRITNTIPGGGTDIAHNIALLIPGTDIDAFAQACVEAVEAKNFVPDAFRSQVFASAPLVHPGQSLDLQLNAPSTPGDYPIICTFPGHCILGMRARLTVE
jgi:azurin